MQGITMSDGKPDLITRIYRIGLKATNWLSLTVWLLFLVMLVNWLLDQF
jgi:hypothetical protein